MRDVRFLATWHRSRLRSTWVAIAATQLVVSCASVGGLSLFVPKLDHTSRVFLASGGPTFGMLVVGLSLVPQTLGQFRTAGGLEYVWSLPVRRGAYIASEVTLWTVLQLPGVLVALTAAAWMVDVTWHPSRLAGLVIVAAAAHVCLIGTVLGLGLPPKAVPLATSGLGLVLLLFAPISVPSSRLPGWLSAVHAALPVGALADWVRATLLMADSSLTAGDATVLVVWVAIACAAGLLLVKRRS